MGVPLSKAGKWILCLLVGIVSLYDASDHYHSFTAHDGCLCVCVS